MFFTKKLEYIRIGFHEKITCSLEENLLKYEIQNFIIIFIIIILF